jgi:predicted amidohydrolase
MKAYQLAVAQSKFELGQIEANLLTMEQIVHNCMKKFPNINLILFPELCTTGYFLSKSLINVAQLREGASFQRLSKIAAEYKIHLAYGYVEKGENESLYNSLQFVDPNGQSLANYRKIHLTPSEREFFDAGREVVTVETEIGKIGLMICWDLAFPELARLLALEGADILLAPSAWEDPYQLPYVNFGMARAIDNTAFLATSNHVGSSQQLHFFGKSSVYGPDGEVISRAESDENAVIVADIELAYRHKLKKDFFTMLEERRTDLY